MPTTYTDLIGLAKPATGELAGTWGDVVNAYLTTYVDAAVAGSQVISGNQTAVTLQTANGTALVQAAGTSTGSAQYQIIRCTGNPVGTLTITAPADSRAYVVLNATSTNQAVVVRGAGSPPTTGVTINAQTRALVAWSGSDYVLVASNQIADLTGTLATNKGGTGLTSFTSGGAVYASSTSALTTGTLPVASGGTGAATLTANNVLLGNGTSALQVVAPSTTGNVLTSNGTTWQSSAPPANAYVGGRGQIFSSSGTFTVPAGITAVKVTVVGAGGNGGASGTGAFGAGGGGGGGGAAIKYVTGLTPSGTVAVTVGTPGSGTSSFGAFASATGGAVGAVGGSGTFGAGGAGGAGTTGDLGAAGNAGGAGYTPGGCPASIYSGAGSAGAMPALSYGQGAGAAVTNNLATVGNAGYGYGAGGSGGAQAGTGSAAGGAGTNGIVIVEY